MSQSTSPEPDSLPRELRSERLLLRRWRDSDLEPFAAQNADPRVMEFFVKTLTRDESDAMVERMRLHFDQHGFGLWAVEIPGEASLAGCLGLIFPRHDLPFPPCVEIGWRLGTEFWGRGLATEGARRVLEFAFQDAKLAEVISITSRINVRSRRVMEKLGMSNSSVDDFEHPAVPDGHRLKSHVLYRLKAPSSRTK